MYQIPETITEHIDEPHVIAVFIGNSDDPALSSLDDLASCVYNARFCGGGLAIGALCSANVSISAYGQHDLSGRDIIVKLGFGDPPEWLQLGHFRVCECRVGDDMTAITAYDAAYWATGGEYTPTVQTPTSVRAVLEDVCAQCGIPLGGLPSSADRIIDGPLTGFTARQTIMNMAAACGCNALIDRSGALCLKWISDNGQSIGPDEYYADELTNATTINIVGVQMKTKITTPSTDPDTGITVEHEEEKTYSSASGTGRVLAVDCPYANQELVDAVAHSMIPLSYAVGNVSFIGGYDVEPGDMLTVTSLNGSVHSVPVLGLTLSLDGGCRAAVKAEGYSDTDTSANFDTEYQQALSRLEAAVIAVKNLAADNIEAQSAYIKSLSSDKAFINAIFAQNITATGTITGAKLKGADIYGGTCRINTRDVSTEIGGSLADISTKGVTIISRNALFDRGEVDLSPGNVTISAGHAEVGYINISEGNVDIGPRLMEGGTALEDKYAAKNHTHSYLQLSGGTITGALTVNGGTTIKGNLRCIDVYDSTVTYGANLHISSGTQVLHRTTSSSRRYKTDIANLPIENICGLYRLPVRTFRYKPDYTDECDERHGKQIPGFIAEELDEILPIAVDHVNGKAEMWNSNIMVPCMMQLIQDLNERVETLEKRLEALERKDDLE